MKRFLSPLKTSSFFIVSFDFTIHTVYLIPSLLVFARFVLSCFCRCVWMCMSAAFCTHRLDSVGSSTSWKCILTIPMCSLNQNISAMHMVLYSSDCARIPMPSCYLIHLCQLNWFRPICIHCTLYVVEFASLFSRSFSLLSLWNECLAPYRIAIAQKRTFIYGLQSLRFAQVYIQRLHLASAFNISNLMESILLVICIRFCVRPIFSWKCFRTALQCTMLTQHCENESENMKCLEHQSTSCRLCTGSLTAIF